MMKTKLALFLLSLEIVWCRGQYYRGPPRHDFFRLSLLWPNSYCFINDGSCRHTVPQNFTISGLWLELHGGKEPKYCSNTKFPLKNVTSVIKRYKDELLAFWPDFISCNENETDLWMDEWEKHGSCSMMNPDQYFQFAISLRKARDLLRILAKGGIHPDGRSYKAERILDVVRLATKTVFDIVCDTDRLGTVYLSEIQQCRDVHGNNFSDCNNLASCDRDPIFPAQPLE